MDKKLFGGMIDQQAQNVSLHVMRADGKEEHYSYHNLFVNQGMDWLASFQSSSPGSAMLYMLVGTISTAATLTNVVGSMGEVARKLMATRTATNNILTEVATFGGAANGITSVSLREVGVTNHASSGPNGDLRSRTVFGAVVLADSDMLRIQYETTVGSR